jgi:hypothetical protein
MRRGWITIGIVIVAVKKRVEGKLKRISACTFQAPNNRGIDYALASTGRDHCS